MAAQADVYIKNLLSQDLCVSRCLPDGRIDIKSTIIGGEEDRFYLPSTDVYLTVGTSTELDLKDFPITVRSDIDFILIFSTNSSWIFKLAPNELPPELPITVKIIIGMESLFE
ncbi:MAG TPA: hypothetical protein VK186_07165 [Candidatus Deferrimicrobium sp.]|nr:hypothetical protein [Candidatus Deferrimicrobium sp.]